MHLWQKGRWLLLPGAVLLASCSSQAPARAQLVVVIDTNAPLVQQVETDPTLSPDAAIDTVRVDVIGNDGSVSDFLDVTAPGPLDWPISFGVQPAGNKTVHLRIRAFRGRMATTGELNGKTTLEPTGQITIDRLVDVDLPSSGKHIVRVLLDEDCLGRPAHFLTPRTTCVDASHLSASPDTGVENVGPAALYTSVAGTWTHAHYVPCRGKAKPGSICIPGGFAILGDPDSIGLSPFSTIDPWPPLPVLLSPYWMDETEFTVQHFKDLRASGAYTGADPFPQNPADATRAYCSWLGTGSSSTSNNDLALTCVTPEIAEQLCEAEGGTLPSEAQWEYEARGRGQGRIFPWGDAFPQCCTASLSRHSNVNKEDVVCSGTGQEPVGSHKPSAACEGLGDESRDGVLDLGGSVSEITRDSFVAYTDPCWGGPGIVADPDCHSASMKSTVSRGGDFAEGPALADAALRSRILPNEASEARGFRCVYKDQ